MEENCIDIYSKPRFSLKLVGCIILFLGIGMWMIISQPTPNFRMPEVLQRPYGVLTVIIALLGLIAMLSPYILKWTNTPIIKIYDDCVEYYVPLKRKYVPLLFIDIEKFTYSETPTPHFTPHFFNQERNSPSLVGETSIEPTEVCELLNEKLKEYWNQPILSEPLNRHNIGEYLKKLGIDSSTYGFERLRQPGYVYIEKEVNYFVLRTINERGRATSKGSFYTEHAACHALVQYLLRQQAYYKRW